MLTRRRFITGSIVCLTGGLLAACSGSSQEGGTTVEPVGATQVPTTDGTPSMTPQSSSEGSSGGREPIRVGLVVQKTGVFAIIGQYIEEGLRLFLDSVNNHVSGREIELVVADEGEEAEQGLNAIRQVVERSRVHILAGIVKSNVAYGMRDYVHSHEIPTLIANAGAHGLTLDPARRSPFIYRTSFANGQMEYPLGPYAVNVLGYERVLVLASDYSAGYEHAEGFKKGFGKNGGIVVDEIYPPLNTNDYGPYLKRVNDIVSGGGVDAVWAFFAGADAVRFVTQYADFGLKDKVPLIGTGWLTSENYLQQLGDSAEGIVTSLHYAVRHGSNENREFVDSYVAKYNHLPSQDSYHGYVTGRVIYEALEAIEGAVEEKDRFLEALRAVNFIGPTGAVRFHPETQNVIVNCFILQAVPSNGEYINQILDYIPDVPDTVLVE